jgi:hypothetical protein
MKKTALLAWLLTVALIAPAPIAAKEKAPVAVVPVGPAAFHESNAAQLAGTKRVAISSVIIQFQAATNAVDGPSDWFRMFQSKATSETVLAWTDFDRGMQAEFAEFAYSKLQADLTAAGFEVVPEAQVKASANYAAILKEGGFPQHTQFGNAMGDAYFVGPAALQPYLPYNLEGGIFENPVSYIGWVSKLGGKSKTPGGPSMFSIAGGWKIPGYETALAKELNAHVVKATYVVTLGKALAKRKRSFASGSSQLITATANAYAEPSLMAQQTHIAFRAPNGSGKWQKTSLTKLAPPKDGDVSVYLASPLTGGTDFFELTSDGGRRKDNFLFDSATKFKFMYFASLRDPQGYMAEVGGMISEANKHMLTLVKP